MSDTAILPPNLITKYRPRRFADFHFDADFRELLTGIIELPQIHFLFMAPPDSCKTTFLYAFLREYYGTEDVPEEHVLFINSLKEQGINYYRNEMKTFCQTFGGSTKKFVVIDDIDTINEQSQQLFRNYIDKYGHNVHFLAMCSSLQKVAETIQSRLHLISLPPISSATVAAVMMHVAAAENLALDPPARKFLLQTAGSSIRPILNNLEKILIVCGAGARITAATCEKLCADMSPQVFYSYIAAVKENQLQTALRIIYEIADLGYSAIDILDSLFFYTKISDLAEEEKYRVIPYLCKFITIFHNLHEDPIELAFITRGLIQELGRPPAPAPAAARE